MTCAITTLRIHSYFLPTLLNLIETTHCHPSAETTTKYIQFKIGTLRYSMFSALLNKQQLSYKPSWKVKLPTSRSLMESTPNKNGAQRHMWNFQWEKPLTSCQARKSPSSRTRTSDRLIIQLQVSFRTASNLPFGNIIFIPKRLYGSTVIDKKMDFDSN